MTTNEAANVLLDYVQYDLDHRPIEYEDSETAEYMDRIEEAWKTLCEADLSDV